MYDKVPFLKTYNSPNPNAGDKKANDQKREATKKAREKIKDDITKLKEKRIKLKADLAKAKEDTSAKKPVEIKRIKKELKIKSLKGLVSVNYGEKD